jgi:paraquat-inducible protein B
MSKRANPAVIGGFVLGALVLIVAAVLALGGGKLFVKRTRAVLFFPGSVQGLAIGAPVLAGGVKVGEVVDVRIRMDLADISMRVPVIVEIDPRRMDFIGEKRDFREELGRWIERGFRGQLGIQSFVTGQLMVTLDRFPGTPVRLAGGYEGLPEIPTVPTPMEELSKRMADLPVGEIAERLASALDGLSTTFNSPELPAALSEARGTLREVRELAGEVRKGLVPLMADADQAVVEAKELARESNLRIASLSEAAESALEDTRTLMRRASARVDPLADRAEATVGDLQGLVHRVGAHLDSVLGALERTTNGDSALGHEILGTLREVSKAARSLRVVADDLDQHPDALLRGKTGNGGG